MTGRRLYHYTALRHAGEIRASKAISRGAIPIPDADGETLRGLAPGWQWLTASDDWGQSWATRQTLHCDRTECRLIVEIPLLDLHRLRRWDACAPEFGFGADLAARFAALGGGTASSSADWYVFEGAIPYPWVTAIEVRPGLGLARTGRSRRG